MNSIEDSYESGVGIGFVKQGLTAGQTTLVTLLVLSILISFAVGLLNVSGLQSFMKPDEALVSLWTTLLLISVLGGYMAHLDEEKRGEGRAG